MNIPEVITKKNIMKKLLNLIPIFLITAFVAITVVFAIPDGQGHDVFPNGENNLRLTKNSDGYLLEKFENGEWQRTSLFISSATLELGIDLNLEAVGPYVETTSKIIDKFSLLDRIDYDNNGSDEPSIPIITPKIIKFLAQPDDSGEFIGNSIGYVLPPDSFNLITDKIYQKTGSVGATKNLYINVYRGTDNTGELYYSDIYPASQFPANTEVEVNLTPKLWAEKDVPIFIEIESDANFSFLTNASSTIPWNAGDIWIVDDYRLNYSQEWSENDIFGTPINWQPGDWIIHDGETYENNTEGYQSGSFFDNINKWDRLAPLQSYGEMWQYGSSSEVVIDTKDVFEEVPGMVTGELKNFIFQNGNELVCKRAGKYKVEWSISFNDGQIKTWVGGIAINGFVQDNTKAMRALGASDTGSFSSNGIITLEVNDIITLQMANNTDASNAFIDSAGVVLIRIDN